MWCLTCMTIYLWPNDFSLYSVIITFKELITINTFYTLKSLFTCVVLHFPHCSIWIIWAFIFRSCIYRSCSFQSNPFFLLLPRQVRTLAEIIFSPRRVVCFVCFFVNSNFKNLCGDFHEIWEYVDHLWTPEGLNFASNPEHINSGYFIAPYSHVVDWCEVEQDLIRRWDSERTC